MKMKLGFAVVGIKSRSVQSAAIDMKLFLALVNAFYLIKAGDNFANPGSNFFV